MTAPRLSRSLLFSGVSAASAGLLLILQSRAGHLLGPEVFGQFGFALTLATFGETLMDLGIHQVTIRAVARDRADAPGLLHNSLALKAIPAAVMLIFMSGFAFLVRPEPTVRLACVLFLVSAVLRSYLLTVRGLFLGLERFGHDTAIVLLDRLLLLAIGVAVLERGGGLVALGWSFAIARLITASIGLLATRPLVGTPRLAFDWPLWRQLQRQALPIGVFLIVMNFFFYIDIIMLNVLANNLEMGLYKAAYTLYEGLGYAPAVLSAVLAPRLANLWKSDRRAHGRLTRLGLAAAAGLAIALAIPAWLAARPLLELLFGATSGYGEATTAFRILVVGLFGIFGIWILQTVAMSVFRERLLLWTTITGAVINVVLNLFLIPAYGRDGAAIATVAAEGTTMVLLGYGLRDVLAGRGNGSGAVSTSW